MLNKSWDKIEEEFLDYYQDSTGELSDESSKFLQKLDFVTDSNEVTQLGEKYLDTKFIFSNGDHDLILRDQLLTVEDIRELCQSFYGQETTRKKIEIYLRSKAKAEIHEDVQVGRLLLLLNSVDILDYSKPTGTVTFGTDYMVEAEGQDSYRITTRTPYSNVKRLRRCLRECSGKIYWADKHFSKKGLEPLSDEISGDDVDEIKILTGIGNVNTGMRDDFKRFVEEMEHRGVDAQLRVITAQETAQEIHDRWILSDTSSWNLPPIDSLYQNQEAEIHKTDEEIPFDRWWGKAHDIIEDWNSIQPNLK